LIDTAPPTPALALTVKTVVAASGARGTGGRAITGVIVSSVRVRVAAAAAAAAGRVNLNYTIPEDRGSSISIYIYIYIYIYP